MVIPKHNDSILRIPYMNDSINFSEADMKDEEQKTQNLKELFIAQQAEVK